MTKQIETPMSLSQLHSFHNAVSTTFMDKWDKIARNESRMKADNWTSEQKAKFELQDRIPFSMPIAVSALHRVSAVQKQSRQSWKVEAASDPNDEVGAEIATIVMRDYERKNDMAHLESDVFDDGVGISFGVDKFEIENEFGIDKITNRKVDNLNFVWDLNDLTYELKKPLFVAEIERLTKGELESQGYELINEDDTFGSLHGRPEINYWGASLDTGTVSLFHHYQLTKKTYYYLLFKDSQKLFNFSNIVAKKSRNKKEINELKTQIELFYAMSGFDSKDELSVETKEAFEYDYYKFTYNQILEYEETGLEFHPYNVYFSIKVANDWISVLDFMSSPQIFMDRIWSQIDYSLRSELKNVYELNVNALASGETAESAMKKVSKTGGVVQKKGYEKIFDVVQSQGFNPQYMQVIGIMQQATTDIMGGANSQGLKESSAESGRAVALRQEQGKLVSFLFLDNLTRYKEAKGKKLLELVKRYDTTERVIKVIGGEMNEQMMQFLSQGGYVQQSVTSNNMFLRINKGIASFQNADLDLVVDTAPMSNYERAAKLDQYVVAEQNMPSLINSPTWQQEKLKLLDIPQMSRAKILQEMQMMQQMQQQMAMQGVQQ
jgi:hypothetical protein